MQPILFKLFRHSLNQAGTGIRKRGVAPLRPVKGLPAVCLRIFGVTKDSTGAALGGCVVQLFRTGESVKVDQTTSDGSGNYEFRSAALSVAYYVLAYKAGGPDVAGVTVNTLLGTS